MQRCDNYGLMGTRRPTMQPERVAVGEVERTTRQTLDARVSEAVDLIRVEPSPRGQTPAPRPVSPAFENRPSSSVVRGGPAHLGGRSELVWALRELRNADPSVLRAEIRRNPEAWARAQANLDRLVAVASGRSRC